MPRRPIRDQRLFVRLREEELRRLKAICDWQDVSMSQATRKALLAMLPAWEQAMHDTPRAVIL